MTITRREFIKQALTTAFAFTAGLLITAVKCKRPARKVPAVVPLKFDNPSGGMRQILVDGEAVWRGAYARAVMATGPVAVPHRWAHLKDLPVVVPLRVARED